MLAYIDGRIASCSWWIFVEYTSRAWWARSPHPNDAIRLRSSDCGGHFSTVNSCLEQSCSRNQFEIIWDLWQGALSCWK